MFYTYVLLGLKDNNLYVGYSNNLKQRVEQHNAGKVESTKGRRPFELIYYEAFKNNQDATAREKFYKTGWGRKHLKKVLHNYFENKGK